MLALSSKLSFSAKRQQKAKKCCKLFQKIALHQVHSNSFFHLFFCINYFAKIGFNAKNVRISGYQNHTQTKSSLHICICQSQLKHKCLLLDTLYCFYSHIQSLLVLEPVIVATAPYFEQTALLAYSLWFRLVLLLCNFGS